MSVEITTQFERDPQAKNFFWGDMNVIFVRLDCMWGQDRSLFCFTLSRRNLICLGCVGRRIWVSH